MSMFDHDNRWSEDEMRDIAKMWVREGHMGALLSGFAGHPDEQLAARAVAEMTAPKKEKPREIRFVPPSDRFERWQKAADALGVPLTIWVQLAADAGITFGQAPVQPMKSPAVPVQKATQDGEGPIWRRILNDMEGRGVAVLKKSDIPKLAARLGVGTDRVVSSLGSMVSYGNVENKGTHFQLTAKE